MNIIFLTLVRIENIEDRGLYQDLMRKFRDEGHQVYIVSPRERRQGLDTQLVEANGAKILHVKTLNIQKTNILEKGIGTVLIESQYIRAIKKHLGSTSFDLITYSTPPITFTKVVQFLKRRSPNAVSYLQLKDIFPQNAVDIGLFGEKSVIYRFFRRKEIALYKTSDYIGCMSPANVSFLLKHNPFIGKVRVEVAPNSIALSDRPEVTAEERAGLRMKYGLPVDKPVFIYGGNLGKPQGINFLVACLDANKAREDCFFLIVGSGTDYGKLERWSQETEDVRSVKVMKGLPKEDYDLLVSSCDVGLIFLDHRFTIPNYPSRLLCYLENKMPVLCATDPNTDIGRIAEENRYGYWCESNSVDAFTDILNLMMNSDREEMGENGYKYLKENYLVDNTYESIIKHLA